MITFHEVRFGYVIVKSGKKKSGEIFRLDNGKWQFRAKTSSGRMVAGDEFNSLMSVKCRLLENQYE